MKKLPARYNGVAMPSVLSIFMSCIVSFVSTWRALGIDAGFVLKWMQGWGLSWMIAFPTLFVILPIVRRVVASVVEPPGKPG
jgi:Protein of unknown function (DUF2798)